MPPAPPQRPHLRERYDSRQQTVIDRCARVFATRGYDGTTIDDLIAATGLTRGGLYHYIGSKAELLTRILQDLMSPLLSEAAAIVDDESATADARLRALVRIWMGRVASHQDHIRVFLQERTTLARNAAWGDVRGDRDAFEALLVRVLREGVDRGEFVIADPQLSALALLGMVNHAAVWFGPGRRLSADEVADGFVDLFLDGVRAA
ncbi:MAG: TetR/AcrR family transcriptional regulator [Patulibacter sp.]